MSCIFLYSERLLQSCMVKRGEIVLVFSKSNGIWLVFVDEKEIRLIEEEESNGR